MIQQFLIIIGLLFLLNSCKQNERKNNAIKNSINDLVISEQLVINDSLFQIFKYDLYTIAFNPIFDGEDLAVTSKNSKTSAHQINKTLTFKQTKIDFSKDGFSEEIISAEIKNSQFKFLDSISIGIKNNAFENTIGIRLKHNNLKIFNLNQTSFFVFEFKNGTLHTILYRNY